MRRGLIIWIAVAVMLSLAVPAGAKGKPNRPSEYRVTMNFSETDGQGLATTTSCGGPIVMQAMRGGGLVAAQPMLETNIPVLWERGHPVAGDGSSLTGCHGWFVTEPDRPDAFSGSLWLDPGQSDTTVSVKWLFDYYWEWGDVLRRNGKVRSGQRVLEMFDLSSEPMAYDWTSTESQLVSGVFDLSWFQKIDGTITQGFTSFTDPDGVLLSFDLQIVPIGD